MEFWGPVTHGIRIRLATDKHSYAVGEPIFVTLDIHNVTGDSRVVRVNSKFQNEDASAPLYDLERLLLSEAGGGGSARSLRPAEAARYAGPETATLAPGAMHSERARLSEGLWWCEGEGYVRIGKGQYLLTAVYPLLDREGNELKTAEGQPRARSNTWRFTVV